MITRSEEIKKQNELLTLSEDASRYLRAQSLLADLRKKYLARRISSGLYAEARAQAINGDVDGATRKLHTALGYEK